MSGLGSGGQGWVWVSQILKSIMMNFGILQVPSGDKFIAVLRIFSSMQMHAPRPNQKLTVNTLNRRLTGMIGSSMQSLSSLSGPSTAMTSAMSSTNCSKPSSSCNIGFRDALAAASRGATCADEVFFFLAFCLGLTTLRNGWGGGRRTTCDHDAIMRTLHVSHDDHSEDSWGGSASTFITSHCIILW